MNYLADTNVIAELSRPRPNPGVLDWAQTVSRIGVSVVTVEELYFGLGLKPNPRIESWVDRFLTEMCDVLPITPAIARHAGKTRGALQAAGATRTQADIFIAATAAHYALTVVTRNERDFQGCGVPVFNPFSR